ncbi:hypothetical protein OG474_33960 [Kribbella sp. NBC_01505]|uniref:IucA/IucC family protein n=1 Tax=Kribbella sp. NBC_01505 TaxID=2903580 RepID=UPI00386E72DB
MTTIDDLIGFGADACHGYAPEPNAAVWLAARRDRDAVPSGAGLGGDTVPAAELGPETRAEFAATLAERGLDLADFQLIALPPRHWTDRIAVTLAGELARRNLVLLGENSYASARAV